MLGVGNLESQGTYVRLLGMPSNDPSTSTSILPTASSPVASSPSSINGRIVGLGVALGIVGLLVIAGVIYATLRMRRKRNVDPNDFIHSPIRRSNVIDHNHPASYITPFGSPGGETPRFGYSESLIRYLASVDILDDVFIAHVPGSNMRVAHRRSDGAWEFDDARAPFTPLGVSDLDVVPSSPSSSSFRSHTVLTKSQEARAAAHARRQRDKDLFDADLGSDVFPPPAYARDGRYIDHSPATSEYTEDAM